MQSETHLFLRRTRPDDAKIILEWENDVENWEVSENDSPYTLYDIQQLIRELEDTQSAGQLRLMIESKAEGRIYGAVDVFNIDFVTKTGGIGILVGRPEDRLKGIGKQSLLLLERWLSEHLPLKKLYAEVKDTNEPSLRLFNATGYDKIGKKRTKLKNGTYIQYIIFEKWLNDWLF